jgi:hypothetical protein
VFLTPGETKKLRLDIIWGQYDKDDLLVTATSSDPAAVVVPPTLKLNFEKQQVEFELELRAGTKKGTFTVTLIPEVGDKVVVKVTVQ